MIIKDHEGSVIETKFPNGYLEYYDLLPIPDSERSLNPNFDHGTGHGVGYLLNVHERPNGIRFRMVPERHDNGVLEAGMITSDEPGLYIEGSHGTAFLVSIW